MGRSRRFKLLTTILFFGIGLAVLTANRNPARTYELSIYSSTPVLFWILIIPSILISTFIGLLYKSFQKITSVVIFVSTSVVYALPLIRGYYFVSEADSLSHLGIVKSINWGTIDPWNLFYPSTHILSLAISNILSINIERSMLIVSFIFVPVFIISITSIIGRISPSDSSIFIGILVGSLMLPITRAGLHFAPNTLARLFLPIATFPLIIQSNRYTKHMAILSCVLSVGLLFLHPQLFLVYCVFLMGSVVSMTITNSGSVLSTDKGESHRIILFLISSLLLYVWVNSKPKFIIAVESVTTSLLFSSPSSTSSTSTRIDSLYAVGGSIPEVFVKIYLPSLVLILLSILPIKKVILSIISKKRGVKDNIDIGILNIFGGSVGIFMLFVATLALSTYYMRVFFASAAFFTILGGVGLIQLAKNVSKHSRLVISIVVMLLIILSTFSAYPSPYVYSANKHVPEAQVQGYSTLLQNSANDIEFVRVRSAVFRYVHAIEGIQTDYYKYTGQYRAPTPDHFANQSLSHHYQNPKYLIVTEADRQRDPHAYNGIRYSEEDFQYLDNSKQIHRIYSNGQLDGYLIS